MICFRCTTQAVSQQVPSRRGFERLFPISKLFSNLSSHFIQEEIILSFPLSIQCCHLSRQSWILPSPVVPLPGRNCSYRYVGFQVVEVCLAQSCQLQDGRLSYFWQDIFFSVPAYIPTWKADWSLRLTLVVQSHSSVQLLLSEMALTAGLTRPELTDLNNKLWEVLHPPSAPFEAHMSLARLSWMQSQWKLGLAWLLQVCRRRASSRCVGNTRAWCSSSCQTVRKARSNLRRENALKQQVMDSGGDLHLRKARWWKWHTSSCSLKFFPEMWHPLWVNIALH